MKIKATIVVPTIREDSIRKFLKEWEEEFFQNPGFDTSLIVIEDNPEKQFQIARNESIAHYDWRDIDRDLGENSWIIPRRTDCIRSYGYWKAWLQKPNMIVTLDDDCYPLEHYYHGKNANHKRFLLSHWNKLNNEIVLDRISWISTVKKIRPRGLPYKRQYKKIRTANVILNHGLWYNVPDFDAKTQLSLEKSDGLVDFEINQVIPKNFYYPMCGMNLAWRPEATPALYFLLMGRNKDGESWGFDRFGDIWAGIIFKKIADHLGYEITSGYPVIWHNRASNVLANLKKEARGMVVNETFWEAIDAIDLRGRTVQECYSEISHKLSLGGSYWNILKKSMQIWQNLFSPSSYEFSK